MAVVVVETKCQLGTSIDCADEPEIMGNNVKVRLAGPHVETNETHVAVFFQLLTALDKGRD